MAENPFFNRVDERNGSVIMDISDTTATADDVLAGKKFYSASGAPTTGTLVPGTITEVQVNGTSVAASGVANIPAASTSEYGVTKLNNTTSSTSTSEAATAAVAKQLNDNINSKFANLGTFSASTESDFFTEVVNQIKTYANGTYVFSAAWQYTSVYIITASKVSNTRIIGSAVPQMQNGRDMVGFSYEGTTLNLYPLALKSKIATLTLRNINWNYTVSARGVAHTNLKTIIDNNIPAGYKYLGIAGYRTNDANVVINAITYLDSDFSLQILNTASSAITNSVNIQYLCIAN